MNRIKLLIISILSVLFILSVITAYTSDNVVDILRRWTFVAISVTASACIVFFFVKDVVLQNKPKVKRK